MIRGARGEEEGMSPTPGKTLWCAAVLLVAADVAPRVASHGMLWWPVNRGSMWRFGYATPVNYDDNALFCGGLAVQWGQNNGSCGECGDDFSLARPRPNENTGKFGTGVTVAKFASGQVFEAAVRITANHRGFFQFKLCPLGSATELEAQECFDKHLLEVRGAGDSRYYVQSDVTGVFNVSLRLPDHVTCEHCVLQWTYTAGNSWGTCSNGTSRLGCGAQETFRTCSDIAID